MVRDREGFLYPHIDPDACVRCGHCTAVCPVLREREPGPLPAVYAAWNKDDTIRKDSTSGGIFSLLAEDTLESGGVVFGAALDARQHLRHIACFKKEELRHLRGAKYVQSDLGDTYREVRELLKSRPVLFSGTPCQVDGLYQFLGSRPENLTTCDLVCHGVPSPGVWEDYVNDLQARKKPLQTVRFRNKVAGWKDSHFTLLYRDGTVDTAPLFATEYGRAFGRALFLRPSCYRCPYTSMAPSQRGKFPFLSKHSTEMSACHAPEGAGEGKNSAEVVESLAGGPQDAVADLLAPPGQLPLVHAGETAVLKDHLSVDHGCPRSRRSRPGPVPRASGSGSCCRRPAA